MKPIVYIDILFLINFLMNSVIIYSTSIILKQHLHIFRLALSASILAIYAAVMFFPQLSVIYSVFFKVLILFLAVLIAFPTKKIIALAKSTVVFFASNLVFGGMTFALIFFTDFGLATGAVISNGEIYLNISTGTLAFSAALAYVVVYILSYIRKNIFQHERLIMNLRITFEEKTITVKALADTGCMAIDPITRVQAIILNHEAAKQLVLEEYFNAINRNFSGQGDEKYIKIYRVIPYKTIGSSGIMNAFVPDAVELNGKPIKNVVIGIVKGSLSENSDFEAVFNPNIYPADSCNNVQQTDNQKIYSGGI